MNNDCIQNNFLLQILLGDKAVLLLKRALQNGYRISLPHSCKPLLPHAGCHQRSRASLTARGESLPPRACCLRLGGGRTRRRLAAAFTSQESGAAPALSARSYSLPKASPSGWSRAYPLNRPVIIYVCNPRATTRAGMGHQMNQELLGVLGFGIRRRGGFW